MSGILVGAATMANDSTASFTVNPTALGTSQGVGNSYTFHGFAASGAVISGTNTFAAYFPGAAFGTATPGTINGATILGVYSVYVDPAATGTSYVVAVQGDWSANTGIINSVTIGGTVVNTGKSVAYVGTNNCTRFAFTTSNIASLFLPDGGSKAVVIQ